MADIATLWTPNGGDWLLSGAALQSDDGLQTAVVLSLFTDRLVGAEELAPDGPGPAGATARRGWWGDAYASTPGDLIGSRLWLLAREKQVSQVLRRAEEYAAEALQWLMDDGIARSVLVEARAPGAGVLLLEVKVQRSAEPVQSFRFDLFWKGA